MSAPMVKSYTFRKKSRNRNLWWEKLMAIVIALNLIVVFFDLTYIPKRSFYFLSFRTRELSTITNIYDPIKGIEANRETQKYLNKTEQIIEELEATNGETIDSPSMQKLLQQMGDLSVKMIQNNPFALANLTGSLEKAKNRMREHIGEESAKDSFRIFWSQTYLKSRNWQEEIAFFKQKIQPLIAINYYRRIDETGGFVDYFWRIDIWFLGLFASEFLIRTWLISRRYHNVTWFVAMLWRWYDIFLLIPFFRPLRLITLIIRLNQAQIINLEKIKQQASRGFVIGIADELTEVIVVEVINQLQSSLKQGDITKFLSHHSTKDYVDLNSTNETSAISKIVAQIVVYKVLPTIRPEAESLLNYSLQKVIKNTAIYQRIKIIPGIGQLQQNLTEQIIKQIYQILSNTLDTILEEDPVFDELLERLILNFGQSIGSEIQAQDRFQKIESLLAALLEEIKVTYVENISEEDAEIILRETKLKK